MSKPEKAKGGANPQQQQQKEKKPKVKKEQQQTQVPPKDKTPNKPSAPAGEKKPKQQQGQPQQQQPGNKKQPQQQQNQAKKPQQQQPSKKAGAAQAKPKVEHEKKEDVFQAVLLADNFGTSIFGPDCPLLQEGLLPMANRKLIDYSLEALTSSGVQEIFLYCTSQTEEFKNYIQSSKWATLPGTAIRVIVGEDSLSLGDALRDLDAKGVLRTEFILMNAGVVSNTELRKLLLHHRENLKQDKGTVFTLVHRKLNHGHRSRSKLHNNSILVVDSSNGKVLAYDHKLSGKRLNIPIDKVGSEMDIMMDSVDTGITICSSSVPPLFTDNFDFTTLQDAIKEIMINEDILGNSIYLLRLEEGYANRVVDFDTFQGISCDILQRWTFPCVPDMHFGSDLDSNNYSMQANFVYKSANVKIRGVQHLRSVLIGANTEIGKNSEVHNTSIGNNCRIGLDVRISNSQIGNDVVIPDGTQLDKCILTNGTILKERAEMTDVLILNGESYQILTPSEREESESDSSDESDKLGYASSSSGDIPYDHEVDQDYQSFSTEVTESLLRGFKANVATENLVLEINGSKFAYNVTFKEVTTSILKGILSVATRISSDFYEKPTKEQWQRTKEVILKLKNVFNNYVKNEESQRDLLEALEEYANDNTQFRPMFMQTMHLLYDEEILSEDSILDWHRNPSLYDAGVELRKLVTKLITWLETPESDSESEEE